MRACVFSDVHGNLHALEAVLDAVSAEEPDEVWCLGDLVGYGPKPNECCRLVAEHASLCLVGNHDLGVLGRIDLNEFSPDAAESARWTQTVLEGDARAFLHALRPSAVRHGLGLYHASPRDPVWEYVMSEEAAEEAFAAADEPLVLVGHSHLPLAFWQEPGGVVGGLVAGDAEIDLSTAERWLLNPGAVGQPRDGDPRASFLVLDVEANTARFRRIPYAVTQTQEEIRELGLPETLAARLGEGF